QRVSADRYSLLPEIRKYVTFANLNLASEIYPSATNGTDAMDLIFCRNALMYFTQGQAKKVIHQFHSALVDGGWFALGATEGSHASGSPFAPVSFPGVILFQKGDAPAGEAPCFHSTALPQLIMPESIGPIGHIGPILQDAPTALEA